MGTLANRHGIASLLKLGGEPVLARDGGPVAVALMGGMDIAGIVREGAYEVSQMYQVGLGPAAARRPAPTFFAQVSFLEDCLQTARARSVREKRLVRCHTISDLDGLSLFLALRHMRKVAPPMAKVAQAYYPARPGAPASPVAPPRQSPPVPRAQEVNSSTTVVNSPRGVETVWKFIAMLLDENMRNKVRFVGRHFRDALVDHAKIDAFARLPRRLGGEVADEALLQPCIPFPKGLQELLAGAPPFAQEVESP